MVVAMVLVTAEAGVVLMMVVMIAMLVVAVVMLMLAIMKMMAAEAEQCFTDALPLGNVFCELSVVTNSHTTDSEESYREFTVMYAPLPALHTHPLSSVEGGLERVAWRRWPRQESKEGVWKRVKEQRELGCHGDPNAHSPRWQVTSLRGPHYEKVECNIDSELLACGRSHTNTRSAVHSSTGDLLFHRRGD